MGAASGLEGGLKCKIMDPKFGVRNVNCLELGTQSRIFFKFHNFRRYKMKLFSFYIFLALMVVALNYPNLAQADNYADTINVFKKSKAVQPFFKNAYGYAVFPIVGKGGFGIGGAFGKGQVYQGGKVTGTSSVVKLSIGWQAGGQALSEIIFFQDKRAYDEFTSGEFAFDAQASAVAITAGIQAQAGTKGATASATAGPSDGAQAETNYKKGMAVFVHAKGGLMYEAAIGGQKFNFTPAEEKK
jgi:lipid-binding SYLF domain-containing protein